MPSALEKLVKVLKLEQTTGCQNKAVIGGLAGFGAQWATEAHAQAKKPEHHALVDELAALLVGYDTQPDPSERSATIKYMLGRITGRIPPTVSPPVAETRPAPSVPIPDQSERSHKTHDAERQPANRPVPHRPAPEQSNAAPRRKPEDAPTSRPSENIPPHPEPIRPERRPPPAERPSSPTPEARLHRERTYQPSIDDLILEPVFGPATEPIPIQQPRTAARPPRRRQDTRSLDEQLEVWHALKRPITTLSGIGAKLAEKLATIGLVTVQDVLNTFPRRYDDYTTMRPLARLRPDELISVVGTVRGVAEIKGKRNIDVLKVTIEDGTGLLSVSFFNQPYLRGKFQRGAQVVFSGKTDLYLGKVSMNNPHWEYVDQEALNTRKIVPVYPLTATLSASVVRRATDAALTLWVDKLPDPVPGSVLDRTGLAELSWAVREMHRPESMELLEAARRRLIFDELLLLQLGVLRNRRLWQAIPADPLPVTDEWQRAFEALLPYALTNAQHKALDAIRADAAQPIPMNRLLQGDVGSGKTVVATGAMLMAVVNGHQAALMAPTGILAEQHYRTITGLLANQPIAVRLLTGATPTAERNEILSGLIEGRVQIVIGTHALIEEGVQFARLGVAVIDEQHRFGVEQRGRLRGKGKNPHVLVMTATPIPRTLALTLHADLDLTVLDELPPGRTPVETRVLQPRERERAYSFIHAQIEKGRQAFLVYPLVEASESETLAEVRSATDEYERLRTEVFPDLRLGLLHGRLSPSEKDGVMASFGAGELDMLVSTSVIEVGIDVPNASVILIEGANRFGLAQLHQFRGRVGRGEHPSFCLLLADDSADPEIDNPRLMAMQNTTDGFKLAEIDWQLRGAGDLLGTRQSGDSGGLAEFISPELVELAQQEARALYAEDPLLNAPEHALLRQRLVMVYGDDPGAEVS
ncbi:MAG: ATP-dependent DNA helicase RecG [Aggregatilineales bacterium]